MDEDELLQLRKAVRAWRRTVEAEETARHAMQDAIAAALDAGIKPIKVTAEAPYSREHVRRAAAESRARRASLPTVDKYDELLTRPE